MAGEACALAQEPISQPGKSVQPSSDEAGLRHGVDDSLLVFEIRAPGTRAESAVTGHVLTAFAPGLALGETDQCNKQSGGECCLL